MKPIWIVDDDQSIRFVLEKALLREGLPTRSFTNPREVMKALEAEGRSRGWTVIRWITAENNYRARGVYDQVATRTPWVTYDIKL